MIDLKQSWDSAASPLPAAATPHPRTRRWARISLRAAQVLIAALATVALVGHVRFRARAERRYTFALDAPELPHDPAALARGAHLANTIAGCAKCHGDDFAGAEMARDSALLLVAPNLTPGRGSAVRGYSDRDWMRAIAHGVAPSGRSLIAMPSAELGRLSDADLSAIISYCKTLRPVDRELPKTQVSALGSVILGLAGAPLLSAELIDHTAPRHDATPAPGATREYGAYLANMCRGCHGPELRGGIEIQPGSPRSADISARAMAPWTFEEFERALRKGLTRGGRPLDAAMPWRAMKDLSDDEMRALWLALHDG